MTDKPLDLERASNVTIQSTKDGKNTAILFKVPSGAIGAVIGPSDYSKILSLLINDAQQVAAIHAEEAKSLETLAAIPIPATAMGIAPGRTTQEAFVSMRLAQMTLVFAVDLSIVREWCTNVLANTQVAGKPVSH